MIGKIISPVLNEIESKLWEWEFNSEKPLEYTNEGFRAACKIFISALMDKMWDLQTKEDIKFEDRLSMGKKAAQDVRSLIKIYTDIDTHDMYK